MGTIELDVLDVQPMNIEWRKLIPFINKQEKAKLEIEEDEDDVRVDEEYEEYYDLNEKTSPANPMDDPHSDKRKWKINK